MHRDPGLGFCPGVHGAQFYLWDSFHGGGGKIRHHLIQESHLCLLTEGAGLRDYAGMERVMKKLFTGILQSKGEDGIGVMLLPEGSTLQCQPRKTSSFLYLDTHIWDVSWVFGMAAGVLAPWTCHDSLLPLLWEGLGLP